MDAAHRAELLERYRTGPGAVDAATGDLTAEELDRRPADGGWTAREVIHHLGDSELISAVRLRMLVGQASPVIQGYDEMELAGSLHYDTRPVEASLAAFRSAVQSTVDLLDRMTEEDWARSGRHTERGSYSVVDWLEIHAGHGHDHAAQIERAAHPDPPAGS
jgi:hypothetical protein